MAKLRFTRLLILVASCAVMMCSLLSIPGSDGIAEEERPSLPEHRLTPQPFPIAVIDVATVLENLPQFRSEQMVLRADVERARSHFQERQNALVQQQQELQKVSPDTPDYKEKIARLQQEISQLQTEFQLQQQEFFNRERQLLLGAYKQIEGAVDQIARERGFVLVLRTSREPSSNNPQELLSYLGREVVWADATIDITKDVVAKIRSTPSKD